MKPLPEITQIEEQLKKFSPVISSRLDRRLSNAPWVPRMVARRRFVSATVLAALAIALLVAATPQGRAFAQTIFRFFVPAQSESFPVPESFNVVEVSSPAPTFALPLETVSPPSNNASMDTPVIPPASLAETPSCDTASEISGYVCQIALAESQVGFDAREFPAIPQGYVFAGAQSDAALRSLTISYDVFEGGGSLTLQQGEGDLLISTSSWGEVPASAIQQVEVNGKYAEFARGTFAVLPGASSATWIADAPVVRLRWSEGDRWFSLEKFGDTAPVEYLDQEALIALAASLVDRPDPKAGATLDNSYSLSFAQVEAAAGFDVLEPTILPEGFEFAFAQYDAAFGFVRILYRPAGQNASDAGFVIIETPRSAANGLAPCAECPPGMEEQVQVNGTPAYYLHGALFTGSSDEPLAAPVWQPDAPNYSLTWATSDLILTINFSANEWFGGRISRDALIRIAESMVEAP